jgi:hypothetical protein
MARAREKSVTGKIFDNIIFLEEVFGDQADGDIPKIPVLEMAKCFDLEAPRVACARRRRSKAWALWKSTSLEKQVGNDVGRVMIRPFSKVENIEPLQVRKCASTPFSKITAGGYPFE